MRATQRKRPQGQLRQGQLITTFGPGAMTDLPERSVLIAGLEDWVGEREAYQRTTPECEDCKFASDSFCPARNTTISW